MLEARNQRVWPGLDSKVLVGWNGLAIGALARAGFVLNRPDFITSASRAADFILLHGQPEAGRLCRVVQARRPGFGVLEDYAYFAEGLIELYETTGDPRYLNASSSLMQTVLDDFCDANSGAFYTTGKSSELLIARFAECHDGATPNPGATAAHVMVRLGKHLDQDRWLQAATAAIRVHGAAIERSPRGFSKALAALDALLDPAPQIVLVRGADPEAYDTLADVLRTTYLPNRLLAQTPGPSAAETESPLPLLQSKVALDNRATAYVCRGMVCLEPVVEADALREQIRREAAAAKERRETQI